jgi:hypothetical protein
MPRTKDEILAAIAPQTKEVIAESFGGALTIRELSRAQWRSTTAYAAVPRPPDLAPDAPDPGLVNIAAWDVACFATGVIGDDGTPIWSETAVLDFPDRDGLWADVAMVAAEIRAFSGHVDEALKKRLSS